MSCGLDVQTYLASMWNAALVTVPDRQLKASTYGHLQIALTINRRDLLRNHGPAILRQYARSKLMRD